ncbi:protein UBASH3A [Biomphalaria pfeifferi]|uniref:Protein UBASH3A n=1 Tax=Biomphalaria pfeifferi TaxID=112525 RepID=A0AAD8FCY4_BIOPF|nr:protein UBASH3A [Biomphalaria pfeifferi]
MASKHRNNLTQSKVSRQPSVSSKCENGVSYTRRLFVMRHGERCDFAFGKSWVKRCFDDSGHYTQKDLNLPKKMIQRDTVSDFLRDSPLTEIGMFQARATGDAFKDANVDIKHVFVSPSLRCVQTAQNVIDGMDNNAELCVEPAAFEWLGWYKNGMPNLLTPDQLTNCGFNVNLLYKPYLETKDYQLDETVSDYYDRCHQLTQHIFKSCEEGDVLIVAHAGSLDTFTRRLRGKNPRTSQEMHLILPSFTYCCLCCLAYSDKTNKWQFVDPPIPPLHEFDWKVML